VHEIHDEVVVAMIAEIVADVGDKRVVEATENLRFSCKPRGRFCLILRRHARVEEDLDRTAAVAEPGVTRLIDGAHPALRDRAHDLITLADDRACREQWAILCWHPVSVVAGA